MSNFKNLYMMKRINHGFIFVPILLGVAAVGVTGAFVYDRMSGGKLSNGIRNYIHETFFDDSDSIKNNSDLPNSTSDKPKNIPVPQRDSAQGTRSPAYESQFDDADDCIYRGTAEDCHDYQEEAQQSDDNEDFCDNPNNISDPRWSAACDFGG